MPPGTRSTSALCLVFVEAFRDCRSAGRPAAADRVRRRHPQHAWLLEYGKQTGLDLVTSGALLHQLELPASVEAKFCDELALRGKEERVAAYALSVLPRRGAQGD